VEQKAARVEISRTLLASLEKMKATGLAYLLTSDESWFTHYNTHQAKWAKTAAAAGQRARPVLTKQKCLVVVTWSFNGFSHFSTVPPGTTYTSDFVVQTLIPELELEISTTRPKIGLSGKKLHCDNARPHTSKSTRDVFAAK